MSDPLEALIRKAIRNGFLSLNLSKDWDVEKWHVTYRNTDNTSVQKCKGDDPIEVMKTALRAGIRDVAPDKVTQKPATKRREDDLI